MINVHPTGRSHWTGVGWMLLLATAAVWSAIGTQASPQPRNDGATPSATHVGHTPAVDEHADNGAAGQASSTPGTSETEPAAPAAPPAAAPPKDPKSYGLWVILPAVVAILLAIFARQVIPALVIGVLTGAYMMLPCLSADDPFTRLSSIVGGFRLAIERYVLGAIHESPSQDFAHLKIIVFTLVIGFTVGVIGRNGGTASMVRLVAGQSKSPRRTALTAWLAGMVVFFDDYANSMIVGPTMRPVFDRVKLSRAKLAYIVDSTAAPVASIALIGTWVGAEIGYINSGIDAVVAGGAPSFLVDANGAVLTGMRTFLYSLPYRFYAILAIVLVFLVAMTGRDFGPMKRSEREARASSRTDAGGIDVHEVAPQVSKTSWWLGLVPIAVLVFGTIGVLTITGMHSPDTAQLMQRVDAAGVNVWSHTPWWERAGEVLSNADSTLSIFYGAILAAFTAVFLTLLARACPARDAVDAGVEGMTRMFPAIVILVLAWAISSVMQDLQLGAVVVDHLKAMAFPAQWLPLAVFACAALISFSTGTSWGTMGILCPMTVEISARLMGGVEASHAQTLFFASVGAVLAGAVFGDHCSPISDTTVLSSLASGCRHEEHVWTQIPYALVAAVAAMGCGDVMCSVYKQPWYLGLAAGSVFLILFVLLVGRRPPIGVVTPAPVPTSTPGPI